MFLNSDDEDDFGKNQKNTQKQAFGRNQQYQMHDQKSQQTQNYKNKKADSNDNHLIMTNQKPGQNYKYGQGTDINFDKLATILKSDQKSEMIYEPGMQKLSQKPSGLNPLKCVDQKVKLTEAQFQNNQNLVNIDDFEDEDEVEDIVLKDDEQKKDVQKKDVQKKDEQKIEVNEETQQQLQKKATNNVMKELYGDSSDESEDSAKAHNEMLQKKEENKTLKLESDEEEDQQADVANQSQSNQQQQPQEIIQKTLPENITSSEMQNFLTNPIKKGVILQMTIKRDKTGFARFYPKYHLCLSGDNRYLMTGKKRSSNKTSNYLISMSKDNLSKKSPDFLGKVRSNFLGTEFHLFDIGENPKKCKFPDKIRKELGLIIYDSNLLGSRGPRKMKIIIPEVMENGQQIVIKPMSNKEGLLAMYKSGRKEQQLHYFNKPPKWNDSVQAFVLNFNGRVDKPSVKNFQLIDENNDENIFLQFGRIGEDAFNLDVQYPFSILQAFGICLSSFDYKIACE
ncbi:hypothetical protein IMG5_144760 [Ichthyophthirius multifiliis]|uniref:Tubby C-terminal domain-containing protein n=1 Tax=Ichthyophthirius multifiliis TaxID=5932 RepID=G0QXR5_ICHMU|nr:hypothetical protein IMG5_144760 [Ichthyophthirius multifiliis]EGR30002.1 hypothetical protein IMG5_144760 [Ichthyophthirius multifiliis]|eukprot:XP_004031238.1 hypothetical protein IMG5_144760 [Ichthyophthirius multifiliis]